MCDFTSVMSEAEIVPFMVTSSRKLLAVVDEPDRNFVWDISEDVTNLLPVVSPISVLTVIGVSGRT